MIAEYFELQGDKLLAGTRMMDYEENSSLELVINSTDSGIPPHTIQVCALQESFVSTTQKTSEKSKLQQFLIFTIILILL